MKSFDHVSNNRGFYMADLDVINMPHKSKLVAIDNLVGNTRIIWVEIEFNGKDVRAKVLVVK